MPALPAIDRRWSDVWAPALSGQNTGLEEHGCIRGQTWPFLRARTGRDGWHWRGWRSWRGPRCGDVGQTLAKPIDIALGGQQLARQQDVAAGRNQEQAYQNADDVSAHEWSVVSGRWSVVGGQWSVVS